ncbi:MAG: Re/Si-specific NAD(P)(+) transhydrogenase subunit alpha [Holosporaceae bacterium]|jgi:NAD(P) transhydrogenase subunit alpha|nr:Re/Si-specific NAD(P)(+) transhydrogenase subunit alpha [Holosporaceae bacterium]
MKISTIIDGKEKRVAIVPETTKKYVDLGFEVVVPKGAGINAGFRDEEYIAAGASVQNGVSNADLYLCVKPSFEKELKLKAGSYLVALLSPFQNQSILDKMSSAGINLCALEKIPRITRAQAMDILSSQANIAGYKAVLEALSEYRRVVPLMMTAAGTIRPAKVLVLGAGVAGLQAIATAKRLGAVVSAFDVRASVKEQVESLGASFIEVENRDIGENSDGYAREMSSDYKNRQAEKLAQVISKADIVITTAQIPGKPAPRLITKEMVKSMPDGAVIVDMSTETGGNCELSEKDKVVKIGKVIIIGYTDLAARVACDSSQLFARNVFNFVSLMVKDGKIDTSDEIIKATLWNN